MYMNNESPKFSNQGLNAYLQESAKSNKNGVEGQLNTSDLPTNIQELD